MNIHGDFTQYFNEKRKIDEFNNNIQGLLRIGIFIICIIGIIGQWID